MTTTKTEIESIVIGTLMDDHQKFDDVKHAITAEMFHNEMNFKLFKFLEKQHQDGLPWDTPMLVDKYPDKLEQIYAMADKAVLFAQFIEYFKILQLRDLELKLKKGFGDDQVDVQGLKILMDNFKVMSTEKTVKTTEEDFQETATGISNAGHVSNPLETGFQRLDRFFGGFIVQQIILVIAATGHAKSLLLWNMILKPLMAGKTVYVYDFEMPTTKLLLRLIAMFFRIPLDWMQYGEYHTKRGEKITTEDRGLALDALATMSERVKSNLVIRTGAKIDDIERDAINYRPDIMVIDTIQAFCKKHRKPNGLNNSDHITDLCGRLNDIVKTNHIAMIQAVQVNRKNEAGIPREEHIRESSGIADNAAVIIGVRDRSKVSEKPEDQDIFDIRIDKNRHGQQGSMTFHLNKAMAKISEYAKELTIEQERKETL